MRKILIVVLIAVFSSNIFAGNMSPKMIVSFKASIEKSNNNFTQKYSEQSTSSFNNLRNTCGTMDALAIHNYFNFRNDGKVNSFSLSKKVIESKLIDIFNNTYKLSLKSFQSGRDIQKLALNRWGWSIAKIRSTSIGYDYDNMIDWDLKNSRPVIALLKANTSLNSAKIDHFITILYASDSQVGYFDPWDGKMKTTTKNKFLSSWVSTNYGVALHP